MWHASIAGASAPNEVLEDLARFELRGVGDCSRGEWVEVGPKAVHVRRRLSADEEKATGPAIDIRGTPEVEGRLANVRHILPRGWAE